MAITAPAADADPAYQPALDQLLDAMQQAAAYDAALPFATADADVMLMTGLQNTNYELLSAGLSRVTELFNGVFFQSPEAVATDAADSRQYFQFFTPDIYYHATAGLAPGATYELTGTIGKGTEAFAIATEAITGSAASAKRASNSTTDWSSIPTGRSPSRSARPRRPAPSTSSTTPARPPMAMPHC